MAKVSPRTAPNPGAYRIEFSSSSWSQLGTVPENVFKQVRRCLESIAAQSETAPAAKAGERTDGPSLHRVQIAGFVLSYERDVRRRTVTLLSVLPVQDAHSHG